MGGGGVAQWVESPTKTSGAIVTRVRIPGAAGDFPSKGRSLFEGVRTAPACNRKKSKSVRTLKIPSN